MTIDTIKGFAACFAYIFTIATMLGLMAINAQRHPRKTDKHIRLLFFTKWRQKANGINR